MTLILAVTYFAVGAWAFRYRCQIEPEIGSELWPLNAFYYGIAWPIALPIRALVLLAERERERADIAYRERLHEQSKRNWEAYMEELETRKAMRDLGIE